MMNSLQAHRDEIERAKELIATTKGKCRENYKRYYRRLYKEYKTALRFMKEGKNENNS